jgi:hypothetical protein
VTDIHLTDIKSTTEMEVTARPMFKGTKILQKKSLRTKRSKFKQPENLPDHPPSEYGNWSTSEHIAIHRTLNTTKAANTIGNRKYTIEHAL